MTRALPLVAWLIATVCTVAPAGAADPVSLVLKDHRFTPGQVSVPAGERFRIDVTNDDETPAEFESSDLRIEKIVIAGGRINAMAGPLKPGSYKFFDDYHPDSASGLLIAVENKD